MGQRARELARRAPPGFVFETFFRGDRRILGAVRFFVSLLRMRPRITYVFDASAAGVLAAALYRALFRNRLVVDTGDAIFELAKSVGLRGPLGLALTDLLEKAAYRWSDVVVVRGSYHRQLLAPLQKPVEVIPDGVDSRTFHFEDAAALRARLGLDGRIVVGLVGSSVWSPRLGICYGWDLVEAIHLLRDLPVTGLIIGSGSGIPFLEERCRALGIQDRVHFIPQVPYEDLPQYLSAIDICLSTQTNDVVGQVRTTGKLPLYLAAGRFVLATDVGEAARVLPRSMLVPYDGTVDRAYPSRLAARIRTLASNPGVLDVRAEAAKIAREHFDYDRLAERFRGILTELA